jgi:membrane fusion protein (multidrug efflux system)
MPALSPIKSAPVSRTRFVSFPSSHLLRGLSVLTLAVVLSACGKSEAPAAAAAGGRPAPEVGVITVAPGDVGLVTELPGRLEASRVAQVRARAAGILQERLFREGSDVKAGQPLFRIDAAMPQHCRVRRRVWPARRPTSRRPPRWPNATRRS